MITSSGAYATDADWEHRHADDSAPSGTRDWDCTPYDSTNVFWACFAPYGEWFYIADTEADYWSPVVIWYMDHADGTAGDRMGKIWHLKGARNGAWRNQDFPEGRGLSFYVCAGSHNTHSINYWA